MNSRNSIRIVVLLCVGVLTGPVLNVNAESLGGGQAGTIQGPIESLNVAGSRLQVRGQDGKVVTVPIDPATKIRLNGQTSSLSALSVGQRVTIQQSLRDGQPVATIIEVQPGSAAGAPGSPAVGTDASSATGLNANQGTAGTLRSGVDAPESRSSNPSARPDSSSAPLDPASRMGGSSPSSGSTSNSGGTGTSSGMSGSTSTGSPAAGTTTR